MTKRPHSGVLSACFMFALCMILLGCNNSEEILLEDNNESTVSVANKSTVEASRPSNSTTPTPSVVSQMVTSTATPSIAPAVTKGLTSTSTPTPLPTPANEISLVDLDNVSDKDIWGELSFLSGGGGGGGDGPIPPEGEGTSITPDLYTIPTIVKAFARRTLRDPQKNMIICGYMPNETLTYSLTNPLGQLILTVDAMVTPLYQPSIVRDYCYELSAISEMEFLATEVGTYTVEVLSQSGPVTHTFEVEIPEPIIYYSSRLQGHIIAGFKPLEEVQLIQYDEPNQSPLKAGKLRLDESGIGLLRDTTAQDLLVVIDEELNDYYPFPISNQITIRPDYQKLVELDPTNAHAYYKLGQEQKDMIPTNSIMNYSKAIELDPNLVLAYYERAEIYKQQNQIQQAIYDYNKVIELDATYLPAYQKLGTLYEEQGQTEDVISVYSQAIERIPSNYEDELPGIYYTRAVLYHRVGLEEQARADFISAFEANASRDYWQGSKIGVDYDQVIEVVPDFALAYYRRGLSARNPEQQLADYNKTIELKPDYLPAYEARAQYHLKWGNRNKAIADYNKLIDVEPNNLFYHQQRIKLFEEPHQKIKEYDHIISRFPHYLIGYYKRGQLYAQLGDTEQALADYNHVIELNNNQSPRPYYARARLYHQLGNKSQAMTDLAQAITLDKAGKYGTIDDYTGIIKQDPNFAWAYNQRGQAHEHQYTSEGYRQAIADYNKAIELDPGYLSAYKARASLYNRLGATDQAIADYSKIIELEPDDLPFYNTRATLYERQGEIDKAIADYSQIIAKADTIDDDDHSYLTFAYQKRIRFYQERGQLDEAIADYSQLIEFEPYHSHYREQALLYERQGQFAEAIAGYSVYMEGSRYARDYYYRGGLYYRLGNEEQAMADFERVLELTTDSKLRQQAEEKLQELR